MQFAGLSHLDVRWTGLPPRYADHLQQAEHGSLAQAVGTNQCGRGLARLVVGAQLGDPSDPSRSSARCRTRGGVATDRGGSPAGKRRQLLTSCFRGREGSKAGPPDPPVDQAVLPPGGRPES
jgi:hypothetical protein